MKTMTTVKRTLAGCGGLALTLALVAGPVAGQERMSEQPPDMSRDMM
ncbi:MAG: hypothetical protein HKO98_11385, partial [Gemmatimonadetes bacterium]|nr:hypothetical protein [Gemmatimonadota bacterium]